MSAVQRRSSRCGAKVRRALSALVIASLLLILAAFGFLGFAEERESRLIDVGIYYGKMSPDWTNLSGDDPFWLFITPEKAGKIGNTDAVGRDGRRFARLVLTERSGDAARELGLYPSCDYYVALEQFDLGALAVHSGIYDVAQLESRMEYYRNSEAYAGINIAWCYDGGLSIVAAGFSSYDEALAFASSSGGTLGSIYEMFTAKSLTSGDVLAIVSASNRDASIYTNMSLMSCSSAKKAYHYRGGFRYTLASAGYFSLVNRVDMEDYLLGVVPVEMSSSYPIEALKSQAIAARNYAAYPSGKYERFGFDLDDSVDSQAYYGYDYEAQSATEAVQATAGEYMLCDGELIQMFFSASSGGYTDAAKNIWGSEELPYLKAKPDPYSLGYRWTYTLTREFLAEVVAEMGEVIGEPQGIEILERTPSGRVQQMRIIGADASFLVSGERFKSVVNMKDFRSTLFSFDEKNAETIFEDFSEKNDVGGGVSSGVNGSADDKDFGKDKKIIKLSDITGAMLSPNPPNIKRDQEQSSAGVETAYALRLGAPERASFDSGGIVVYGHGYGHGIGLSQLGAVKMAELGRTYTEILEFYYTKITGVRK